MAALQKGKKWTEIRDALRTWSRDNVQNISSGQRRVGIPNVAFELMLERDDNLPPSFIISRVLDSALDVT